jgi:hypothetical protein
LPGHAVDRDLRTVDGGLAVRLRPAGVLPLAALLFFGCGLWSATLLLRIRKGGVKFAVPFLICALTLAALVYAPLQQVACSTNFYWHRADRERIVARVENGELKPNVGYNKNLIALGDKRAQCFRRRQRHRRRRDRRRHLRAVPDLARPETLFHGTSISTSSVDTGFAPLHPDR